MSQAKENAAMAALDFVESGMTLGLGSGSTAEIFLERLGERIAGGLKVQGIPTSQRTADVATENGVIYAALMESGCENAQTVLRQKKDGSGPLITDGGHYILDSRCRKIPKPAETAHKLAQIPGVMEHGIFIDLADVIIIGETDHAKVMELARG